MSEVIEFMLAIDLRPDTPQQVIDTLKYMTRKEDYEFNNPPDLYFFKQDENSKRPIWRHILQVKHEPLTHHPGEGGSAFHKAYRYSQYGKDVLKDTLSFRVALHDDLVAAGVYDFISWLAIYSETQGFVGYCQTQGNRMNTAQRDGKSEQVKDYKGEAPIFISGFAQPTLIYFWEGKAYFSERPDDIVLKKDGWAKGLFW
jgi:hypothetical protein